MIDFLIKSTLSLGLFLAMYYLVLEREKMHRFNRFYLLFSILFSLAIPFFHFEMYNPNISGVFTGKIVKSIQLPELVIGNTNDYASFLLWSIYGCITAILLFRFVRNLIQIKTKIKNNTTEQFHESTLILVPENILPYTFLNYIFLNKEGYTNQAIREELYTHELTHVIQKHTYDVLFIEILKVIFWFNPLLYIFKTAIQLNHEFLADEKVVHSHNNVPSYQTLLLEKATWKPVFSVTSNLNFLITKKRFTMMTKTTPAYKALFKKAILLPLCFGLVLLFCTEITAQEKTKKATKEKVSNSESDIPPPPPPSEQLPPPPPPPETEGRKLYTVDKLTVYPEYKKGMSEFYKYVAQNFNIPKDIEKSVINKTKIIVSFIVEKDGTLSNVKCITEVPKSLEKEAIDIVSQTSKQWTPGMIKKNKVRVVYTLPIKLNVK
ncbi:M56 family metallopeptidase [Flavobacterium sp. '19STA2R22 D10 B1']|uniref:M56 family metallopeptidase n=1 Tax=Flavobacterium aerium TaxID=3037261 RepID=UPI00278C4D97|nr:M56 family metallopeptidase [Flavobacterium sp. '19STA2R22 D10 B1']